MIPEQHLPLVLPFKYLGVDEGTLKQANGVLQPHGGRGIFTKRRPADRSDHVDPVHGYDPAAVTAPATQAAFGSGLRSSVAADGRCCSTS